MKIDKIILKRIVSVASFILIFLFTIIHVSMFFSDKSSFSKNADFFAEKENFDVLFFGSSHSEIFYNPLDLWNEYGITSYNLGAPEESIPVSYWTMKNAIAVHKPKVIVFDISMYDLGEMYTNDEHLHYAIDSFPISKVKYDATMDLIDDTNKRVEMFFTLGRYHNRWKSLEKKDFSMKKNNYQEVYVKGNLSYGFYHTIGVVPFEQCELIEPSAEIDDTSIDYKYLNKIIDLCADENINLLLVANPFQCDEVRQESIYKAQMAAYYREVPFINYIKMDSVIDMRIDLYDKEHVNQSGLHKMSDYIGSYLINNYSLLDHRNDAAYLNWDKAYDGYKQLKLETLWWLVDDLTATLECLHDKDYTSYVFIGKDVNVSMDELIFMDLLQNIGRENLTVFSDENLKSAELRTLNRFEESYGYENYLLINGKVGDTEELVGKEAVDTISTFYEQGTFTSNDLVIVVCDRESGELKLIRRYSRDGNNQEDVVVNVPKLFFD